jgi:hypothetical protein
VRVFLIVAACALIAALSGVAAYNSRSPAEPARVAPIELDAEREPEPARQKPRSERRRNDERPASSSVGGAAVSVAPAWGADDDAGSDQGDGPAGDDGDD